MVITIMGTPSLRKLSNAFVLNLAVSDLLFVIISCPTTLAQVPYCACVCLCVCFLFVFVFVFLLNLAVSGIPFLIIFCPTTLTILHRFKLLF